MLAGAATTRDIAGHLNSIGNVMNMGIDAHVAYDRLDWGIEAREECRNIKYLFRVVPSLTDPDDNTPGLIVLKDGDEIHFGKGPNFRHISFVR